MLDLLKKAYNKLSVFYLVNKQLIMISKLGKYYV